MSRIFLAGAAGAIGRRLVPMLAAAGHTIIGTTRSAGKADALSAVGVEPVIVDVFDREALKRAVERARPEIVIHQLTDLSAMHDPDRMAETLAGNARLRTEGTRNLVDAAEAAGARRLIAQSIAWVYAPGTPPYAEEAPLDIMAEPPNRVSVDGVIALESAVLSARLAGIVLRYGLLYGPNTGADAPNMRRGVAVHVDAAARAAFLAIDQGAAGAYNIADAGGTVAIDKARRELGFDPEYRLTGQALKPS